MFEFIRSVFARNQRTMAVCGGLTVALAMLSSLMVPEMYFVEARLLVREPAAVHRLANPFAAVPSSRRELVDVSTTLHSHDQLKALIERTKLVERWDEGRPLPLKLLGALRGQVSDEDRRNALVTMLEQRLIIEVEGERVHIFIEWPSKEVALDLVQNCVKALMQLRLDREVKGIEENARALDRQYAAVKAELRQRVLRLDAAGNGPNGWAAREAEREKLVGEQSRAAELLVAAEEKHITADVFRRSNALRFTAVKPAVLPKHPVGAELGLRLVLFVLAALLATLVCGVLLRLAAGPPSIQTGAVQSRLAKWIFVGLLAAVTGLGAGVTHGKVLALLAPLAFVVGWVVWTQPLRWPLFILLFITVLGDDPSDRPYVGLWKSPLWNLGKLFFSNVALFTGSEMAVLGLTLVMVLRRTWVPRIKAEQLDPMGSQAPRALQIAVMISGVVVCILIVLGLARGGIFREALWQFRALLMMPIIGMLAMYALDFPKDLPNLFTILLTGSLVKALFGTYFIYAIAYPQGEAPPHTTGHNDTMIFVTAVVAAVCLLWEKPSQRHFVMFLLWMPFVAMGLRLNDRRVAYVDIFMALGLIYMLSPWHAVKRKMTRGFVMMLPALLLYSAVGWNTKNAAFAPVQKIRSIIAPEEGSDEEGSNVERDIENFNIMKTWYQNMFVGQGFGHAFTEYVPVNDFAQSAFGHIGHNSILWLLWIGGIIGFTGVLGYLAVALYFLGRTLHVTHDWRERVGLLTGLSTIVTYLMQAFGDMGTQSVMFDFFVGVSLAVVGRLATKNGAWNLSVVQPVLTAPAMGQPV